MTYPLALTPEVKVQFLDEFSNFEGDPKWVYHPGLAQAGVVDDIEDIVVCDRAGFPPYIIKGHWVVDSKEFQSRMTASGVSLTLTLFLRAP